MTALRVLHHGAGYVAVDKPAGILVIPGRGGEREPALRDLLSQQLGREVWVVHRLDRETSGVVLFALEAGAHRCLSMAFEAGQIHKRYLALVAGRVEGPLDLAQPLVPARRGRMRVARAGEQGKPAQTRVLPRHAGERASLVEAEPLTGRQHQIRVHLAAAGHPLLVDRQYARPHAVTVADLGGDTAEVLLVRTPLHALQLNLPRLDGIAAAEIEAPLPDDMRRAVDLLVGLQRST